MAFIATTIDQTPVDLQSLNGLRIVGTRLPSAGWRCAFDQSRQVLWTSLPSTVHEQRDGDGGFSLLCFGQDPVVIQGQWGARIHDTPVSRRYKYDDIVRTVREARAVLYPPAFRAVLEFVPEFDRTAHAARVKAEFDQVLADNGRRSRQAFSRRFLGPLTSLFAQTPHRHRAAKGWSALGADVLDSPGSTDLGVHIRPVSATSCRLTLSNRTARPMHGLHVSASNLRHVLAPGALAKGVLLGYGLDYLDYPDLEEIKSVTVDKIAGPSVAQLSIPRLGHFTPTSGIVFVEYALGKQQPASYRALVTVGAAVA